MVSCEIDSGKLLRYTLQFYKNGTWTKVVIDDRIPCNASGRVLYARSKDPNEIWVLLIEKAYAKIHHAYENLISGFMTSALADFTGGLPQTIKFDSDKFESPEFLWQQLLQSRKSKHLMGAAFSVDKGQPVEKETDMGIIHGHAYGVLDARESGGFRLVQVQSTLQLPPRFAERKSE